MNKIEQTDSLLPEARTQVDMDKRERHQQISPNETKITNSIIIKNEFINNAEHNQEKKHMTIKKRVIFKQILSEVFRKSTMHGVAKIFNSKNAYRKIMWIMFLMLSCCLFGNMTLLSLLNYNKHEVITKIRTISERPTLFPTVTICNKIIYTSKINYKY